MGRHENGRAGTWVVRVALSESRFVRGAGQAGIGEGIAADYYAPSHTLEQTFSGCRCNTIISQSNQTMARRQESQDKDQF